MSGAEWDSTDHFINLSDFITLLVIYLGIECQYLTQKISDSAFPNQDANKPQLRCYIHNQIQKPPTDRYSLEPNKVGSHGFLRKAADPISCFLLNFEVNRARSCCLAQKQHVTYSVTSNIFPFKQKGMLNYIHCLPINLTSYLEKDSAISLLKW